MKEESNVLNKIIEYLISLNMSNEDIEELLNNESLISIYVNSVDSFKLTRSKK